MKPGWFGAALTAGSRAARTGGGTAKAVLPYATRMRVGAALPHATRMRVGAALPCAKGGWPGAVRRCAMLLLSLLAACHMVLSDRIAPGMTEAEVQGRAGAPTEQRTLADGSTAWYYVNGPQGWTTYRVRFTKEGRVAEVAQVLTIDNFEKRIKPRYTNREQLAQELGRPASIAFFPRMDEEVWQYRYMEQTTEMLCDVHIDEGTGVVKRLDTYRDPAYTSGRT